MGVDHDTEQEAAAHSAGKIVSGLGLTVAIILFVAAAIYFVRRLSTQEAEEEEE